MRSLEVRSLLVLFVCLPILVARADPVAIVNAGFEEPMQPPGAFTVGLDPPGWTFIGTTRRAVWNISNNPFGWFPNLAPEGDQVGALWAGSFLQTLGVVLLPNTTYTLQADFSHAPGFPSEFTIELLAGGVSLGSAGGFPVVVGLFDTATVIVTTGAAHPHLGETLAIRISSTATESDFDNIRLDASTISVDPCSAFGGDADEDGICDDVDDCPGTASGDPVDASGCSDAQQQTKVTTLIDDAINLINGLGLDAGTTATLLQKLQEAQDKFDLRDLPDARSKICDFVGELEAAVDAKNLTTEEANQLLKKAGTILGEISFP